MTAVTYQYKAEPIHVATCFECQWESRPHHDTKQEAEADRDRHNAEFHP